MPRKLSSTLSATLFTTVLAVAFVGTLSAETAAARGVRSVPVTFTGFTSCNVNGKVTFSPPLRQQSDRVSAARIEIDLTDCTNATQGGVTITQGKLEGFAGTVRPDTCSSLSSEIAPALAGGRVQWEPTSRIRPSEDASVPAGDGSIVSSDDRTFLQVSYSGGSVRSGSFANVHGTSVTILSTEDTSELSSRCAGGLSSVDFTGTATL